MYVSNFTSLFAFIFTSEKTLASGCNPPASTDLQVQVARCFANLSENALNQVAIAENEGLDSLIFFTKSSVNRELQQNISR